MKLKGLGSLQDYQAVKVVGPSKMGFSLGWSCTGRAVARYLTLIRPACMLALAMKAMEISDYRSHYDFADKKLLTGRGSFGEV